MNSQYYNLLAGSATTNVTKPSFASGERMQATERSQLRRFLHRRRLLKMTAGARFESPSEWPKGGYGEGCPPPHRGWGLGGLCPTPDFFLKLVAEINTFW